MADGDETTEETPVEEVTSDEGAPEENEEVEAAAEDAFACPSWRAPSKKCHASPLWTFEPSADGCAWWHSITRLSRSAFARALAGRTLRFIGDSLALDQYRHLARCVLNCSSQEVQPRNINQGNLQWTEQMDAELRAAGSCQG